MKLFIIADFLFLIISIVIAIHHAHDIDSSMYYGFVMIAYLLVRQGISDTDDD